MNSKKYLFSSIIAVGLLSGCNTTSDDTKEQTQSTVKSISGQTTLSKGLVCLDVNNNKVCDESEASAQTDVDGSYTLELDTNVEDGTTLIAKDGYNLILQETNLRRLEFYASYQRSEKSSNINTMTTLIYNKMDESLSYKDSKAYFASKYNISNSNIAADPIKVAKSEPTLLQLIRQTEKTKVENAKKDAGSILPASSFRAQDSNSSSTVTEDEVDATVEEGSYLDFDVDAFLATLQEYFDSIKEYIYSFFTTDENVDLNESNGSENIVITREVINGIWFIQEDNSTRESCMSIDNLDNLTIYTKDPQDGSEVKDEYALEFDEAKSTLDLILAYTSVETFHISESDGNSFKATFSDGSLQGVREESLPICQNKL